MNITKLVIGGLVTAIGAIASSVGASYVAQGVKEDSKKKVVTETETN